MAHKPPPQYDDGLELAQYQAGTCVGGYGWKAASNSDGMKADEYMGMEVHEYQGGNHSAGNDRVFPEDTSEKLPFASMGRVYEEDKRSHLRRELKTRQISMIALGGALGTGLLINTGPYLAQSGPVSMLIGYALVGVLCYAVMAGLGEMACWLPLASGFTGLAGRFADPALGFALGWNYWFKYIVTTPNNIIAFVLVIKYWFDKEGYYGPGANPAIYVSILLAVIIAINYFGVGVFGEFEFWLSSVKVLIMLGLIIFTLVLAVNGGPSNAAPGFNYLVDPGAFAPYLTGGSGGKFLGFWNVLSSAVFSFLGAELVGVTVGEAQNPRKAVPRAVKLTFFRIVFFYIILIFLLGLTVPYNSPLLLSANNVSDNTVSAEASPFVVAARLAGVKAVPDIINVCLLAFTFSAANSDLYIATRSLYSLAVEGSAPRIFSRTNSRGVPIYALALSAAFCTLAFMIVDVGTFTTFQYFVSLVTIFGILTWISILLSHISFIRARRAQNIPDTALAYVSPFGIRGSIAALVFACVILLFNGFADFVPDPITGVKFQWQNFIVNYIGVIIYAGMFVGYKIFMRTKTWKPQEVDLYTGKARIDEEENEFLAGEMKRNAGVKEKRWAGLYRVTLGNFF
ncbi:Uncharacterized protein BP5553_02871 [Venustampulla echinocandica]|uniref:Amino acid permease/ SLC12A domain-containing protein n=1 Tax=Venustampulla echinocandica TaxID=2656787 RepID=A0A370TSM7_9HELO|nr:Uncharacterized protein BP5553_02871 [Venustampulla echinocandica]RDL38531.1 Uncharacterized protein BP5553_02871 [Venustampulla echinocandica]